MTDNPDDEDPRDEAHEQSEDAQDSVSLGRGSYLHFPWSDLDGLVGGIGPGEVWFVGAYSGHGKTTFLMSALNAWFEKGVGVYYMGLESRPHVLRTQWACQRLGLNAGDVLSGKLHETPDWPFTRKRIVDEIHADAAGVNARLAYFCPEQFVDEKKLRKAAMVAYTMGSEVLIIDHVDHLSADGHGLYERSVTSMKTLLAVTQEYGLKTLAATQFNNEMIRGNRLGMHSAPTPNAVYMGNHKRHIATGMLGVYRPLKFSGLSHEDLLAFAKGQTEPQTVLEPGVMAVSLMKHRLYGNREGKRIFLKVENGAVKELPTSEQPHL